MKKKWILKTTSAWAGTEQIHEIEGEYETEEEALEAFGGFEDAEMQAQEDHGVEWCVEEEEED